MLDLMVEAGSPRRKEVVRQWGFQTYRKLQYLLPI
jgi:hypothetical protein